MLQYTYIVEVALHRQLRLNTERVIHHYTTVSVSQLLTCDSGIIKAVPSIQVTRESVSQSRYLTSNTQVLNN